MIINTGMRTDIPAYYSEWLMNRIREGYVLVRNPYYPEQVSKYILTPEVVDILCFCTKNPKPMLKHLEELKGFRQFWFVTITPYGKEIEPNVPDKREVIAGFRSLSETVGKNSVGWRYDPIFINEKYTVDYHKRAFKRAAELLCGYTNQAVISFIDLYSKTKRNFPEVREVNPGERAEIGKAFAKIGKDNGITVRTCFEGRDLEPYGIDVSGCMTKKVLEDSCGIKLELPRRTTARPGCSCVLGNDIGAYNTCPHLCRYCYANYDKEAVLSNFKKHDPNSPFLIGTYRPNDIITQSEQISYASGQLSLF